MKDCLRLFSEAAADLGRRIHDRTCSSKPVRKDSQAYELTLQKLELEFGQSRSRAEKSREFCCLDYVKNVHEELGKMDRNSSINIRGKSIKMFADRFDGLGAGIRIL